MGNSSAGIKECSFLGVPAVNIGDRQRGRLRAENVVDAPPVGNAIVEAIENQLSHGRYSASNVYYSEFGLEKSVNIIKSVSLQLVKEYTKH